MIAISRASFINENHCFQKYSNAKTTFNFMIVAYFLKSARFKNNGKLNGLFYTRILTVLGSGDLPMDPIRSLILTKKSLKYVPAIKNAHFRNVFKTKEISSFPPPKITNESYYIFTFSDASVPY